MSYLLYIDGVLMPVTPGQMRTTINGKNETVTLINEGEVNIKKAPGLTDIVIDELLLPSHDYNFIAEAGEGERGEATPKKYLDLFEKLKTERADVDFLLIRTTARGDAVDWDTKMRVTLEDYEINEDADEIGDDVVVTLNFKQYKEWGAKKLKVTGKTVTTTSTKRPKKNKNIRKYKIKKGDTLKKIAKKYLNDSSRSKRIYKRNKKVLEAAAKKHGRKSSSKGKYIYPGTVISINLKDWNSKIGAGIEDNDSGGGGALK